MRIAITYFALQLLALYRWILTRSEFSTKFIFVPGMERLRWQIGQMKAWLEFERAKKQVPAYRQFLSEQGFTKVPFHGLIPDMTSIPTIDKENYVKPFSMGERCRGGKIPAKGVVIDESSGSSGKPTNWARGAKERKFNKHFLSFGLHTLLGNEPIFMINAFALGPWATGMNVSMAFVEMAVLKSLGPDIPKILNTLQDFGTEHKYVILGYPPFLKTLVDSDIDWDAYNVTFIVGGESISESMRTYMLEKGIRSVYSSFGASDLELNISTENDTTIALRKLLSSNQKLAKKLVRHPGATPMIFQFAPFDFFIETNDQGELLISICRPGYLSPKIRYNIHDLGHVIRRPELETIFEECGISPEVLPDWNTDLPFLFHYGRSDMSVAYFGANIAPGDVQEAIFSVPEISTEVKSFTMQLTEDESTDKRLSIFFECHDQDSLAILNTQEIEQQFFDALAKVNQDFREAFRMMPLEALPTLLFLPSGEGPFQLGDIRIKTKYIQENSSLKKEAADVT